MAQAKSKVFVVTPKVQREGASVALRLIRANRVNQVQAYLLNELNIMPASADDCIRATKEGVEVEQVPALGSRTD